MRALQEILRRKQKAPVPSIPKQEAVTSQLVPEQKEQYPNTIVGILKRVEGKCSVLDYRGTREELGKAYEGLLEIYQDGVANYRKLAQRQEKPWKGRISASGNMREQDGVITDDHEYLDIGVKYLKLSSGGGYYFLGDGHHDGEEIEMVGSANEQEVTRIRYRRLKTEEADGIKRKKVLESVEARFSQRGNPVGVSVLLAPEKAGEPSVEYKLKFPSKQAPKA
ncbi:MAG: hypothetical protein A2857_02580 [Candidatus Levybacteria bacterium RIFCSPHIGHO2_01_FULL_36_15]|nr:MAG: hypothetical protein A2857_02580 [Candidatus Levybacteria bacterium RIFCSPHIGHO2_01_FULL_36_15]OGH38874.1 MAG: hypothetical protein A2905_04295 [Candidatus Levybacteria bacterium RIFCSPLOWO2_01_FULL_36_10]